MVKLGPLALDHIEAEYQAGHADGSWIPDLIEEVRRLQTERVTAEKTAEALGTEVAVIHVENNLLRSLLSSIGDVIFGAKPYFGGVILPEMTFMGILNRIHELLREGKTEPPPSANRDRVSFDLWWETARPWRWSYMKDHDQAWAAWIGCWFAVNNRTWKDGWSAGPVTLAPSLYEDDAYFEAWWDRYTTEYHQYDRVSVYKEAVRAAWRASAARQFHEDHPL